MLNSMHCKHTGVILAHDKTYEYTTVKESGKRGRNMTNATHETYINDNPPTARSVISAGITCHDSCASRQMFS